MAFFLIGKGPDDDLRVLSRALFATRQDAMAELSRLSSEPGFDQWDADVLVMDLDTGVPVLLVRPATTTEPAPAETPADSGADAWIADIPAATPATESAAPPQAEPAEEPAQEAEPVVAHVEPAPAEELELEPAAPLDTPSMAEIASAWSAPAVPDDRDELRDAILRTTQRMSADGITPPPSAGLPDEPEPAANQPAEGAVEVAEAEPEPAAKEPEAVEEPAAAPETRPTGASAWPWASGDAASTPEPVVTEVYDALAEPSEHLAEPAAPEGTEAPATGFESLVEPVTSAREPMSAQAESPAAPAHQDESDFILDLDSIESVDAASPAPQPADAPADAEPAEEPAEEPAQPLDEAAAPTAEAATEPEPVEPAAIDDDAVTAEAAPQVHQPLSPPVGSPLTEYTCDDCVWVATCPNRDHRLPKDCGSFQWK